MKLEHLNPGGSHKVRIALHMIVEAERQGILRRGSGQTIIEPTGGNTGAGLAMAAAVLGYRLLLVIPDNYSEQKQRMLRALGAEIVLSNSASGNNSHGQLAQSLCMDHPEFVLLNQQANPANPDIHREQTAQEVLRDLSADGIDVFVAGVGTGGHLTGIGEVLKRRRPDTRVVAVQPEGCDLLGNRFTRHAIQGLAVGLIPAVLNLDLIDEVVSVSYEEARSGMAALMRKEGLAVGISSGANVVASQRLAQEGEPGTQILTVSYDNAADYPEILKEIVEERLPSCGGIGQARSVRGDLTSRGASNG